MVKKVLFYEQEPCAKAFEFRLCESSRVRGEASQLISGFTKVLQSHFRRRSIEGCIALDLPVGVGVRCDRRVVSTGFAESPADSGTRLETLNVRGEQVRLADCSVRVWASWFKRE